jgi:hypothetical protein
MVSRWLDQLSDEVVAALMCGLIGVLLTCLLLLGLGTSPTVGGETSTEQQHVTCFACTVTIQSGDQNSIAGTQD